MIAKGDLLKITVKFRFEVGIYISVEGSSWFIINPLSFNCQVLRLLHLQISEHVVPDIRTGQ